MHLTQPSHVRKRDGRLVAFDHEKLVNSLIIAATKCCSEKDFFSNEIAEAVSLHLAKEFLLSHPTTEDIAEAINIVLSESSWAKIGDEYRNYRLSRNINRSKFKVLKPNQPSLFEADKTVMVTYNQEQRSTAWNRSQIIKALETEANISTGVAEEIAKSVEEKVIAAGLSIITTTLIRAITDNELLVRGYMNLLSKRNSISFPYTDIEKILDNQAEDRLALKLGSEALPAFCLNKKFSNDIAMAHRRAIINIAGLKHPNSILLETITWEPEGNWISDIRRRNFEVLNKLISEQLFKAVFDVKKITPLIEEVIDYSSCIARNQAIVFQFETYMLEEALAYFEGITPTKTIVLNFWGNDLDLKTFQKIISQGWQVAWSPEKTTETVDQLISINLPQTVYRSKQNTLDGVIAELDKSIDYAIQAIRQNNVYQNSQNTKAVIDLIGLKETVHIITGSDIFEKNNNEACEDILLLLCRDKLKLAAQAYKLDVALTIQPSNSCGKRFAAIDQSLFPELFGYLDLDNATIENLIPPYSTLYYNAETQVEKSVINNKKTFDLFDFIPVKVANKLILNQFVENKIAFSVINLQTNVADYNSIDHPELPGLN